MAKRIHNEFCLYLKYKALIGAGERQNQQRGCTIIWYSSKYSFHMEKNKDKIFQAFQQESATTKRVKLDTYHQVNKTVLKWFKRLRSENFELPKFSSIRWLVGQMEKKVGFNFFYFRLLLYNYSNLGSLSLRISMNFSSAVNKDKKKRKPSFLNSTVSLLRTLIFPPLEIPVRVTFYNSNLSLIRI